jgi:flagellar motility protein MotE (MotC chaperone)
MKFRLLPAAILVATTLLGVKLTGLWHGAHDIMSTPAIAQTAQPQTIAAVPDAVEQVKPSAPRGAELADDPTLMSQSEIDLLQRLAARRNEMDNWNQDLDLREKLLKAAEQRLDKKLADLQGLQDSIKGLLKQHEEEQETKLKSLVKIYETMKPKDAANVFEKLDMNILLDVVERMKEAKIAPIIAAMNPDKAKSVTEELAGRRKIVAETVAQTASAVTSPAPAPAQAAAQTPAQPVAGMIPPAGNPPAAGR